MQRTRLKIHGADLLKTKVIDGIVRNLSGARTAPATAMPLAAKALDTALKDLGRASPARICDVSVGDRFSLPLVAEIA